MDPNFNRLSEIKTMLHCLQISLIIVQNTDYQSLRLKDEGSRSSLRDQIKQLQTIFLSRKTAIDKSFQQLRLRYTYEKPVVFGNLDISWSKILSFNKQSLSKVGSGSDPCSLVRFIEDQLHSKKKKLPRRHNNDDSDIIEIELEDLLELSIQYCCNIGEYVNEGDSYSISKLLLAACKQSFTLLNCIIKKDKEKNLHLISEIMFVLGCRLSTLTNNGKYERMNRREKATIDSEFVYIFSIICVLYFDILEGSENMNNIVNLCDSFHSDDSAVGASKGQVVSGECFELLSWVISMACASCRDNNGTDGHINIEASLEESADSNDVSNNENDKSNNSNNNDDSNNKNDNNSDNNKDGCIYWSNDSSNKKSNIKSNNHNPDCSNNNSNDGCKYNHNIGGKNNGSQSLIQLAIQEFLISTCFSFKTASIDNLNHYPNANLNPNINASLNPSANANPNANLNFNPNTYFILKTNSNLNPNKSMELFATACLGYLKLNIEILRREGETFLPNKREAFHHQVDQVSLTLILTLTLTVNLV
jgi:hypothetical protein